MQMGCTRLLCRAGRVSTREATVEAETLLLRLPRPNRMSDDSSSCGKSQERICNDGSIFEYFYISE